MQHFLRYLYVGGGVSGKQLKCHSNKCWYNQSIKYYTAIKNEGDRAYVAKWKNTVKCNIKER